MKRLIVAGAVLLLGLPSMMQAQTGLSIGAQATSASLNYKDAAQNLGTGSGIGFHAGLSLGHSFGVLVNYDKNSIDATGGTADLGQTDVLGRLGLIALGPIKTSGLAGYTSRVAKTDTYKLSGKNLTAGLMASIFTFDRLSIDGTVLWSFGSMKPSLMGNATTIATKSPTGARVSLGASWYLFGGN